MCMHVSASAHVCTHMFVHIRMRVHAHTGLSLPSPHASQSHRNVCPSKLRCRGSWNHVTADFLICAARSQGGVRHCHGVLVPVAVFNLRQAVRTERGDAFLRDAV